ncbi:MAG: carboxypeptidase regulatory-like domain-containing protein [Actinobacteria bacterium]|nr:carboxypeptidase regulatory-like domain-containing protein [Actinomycetota bacterium]
MIVHNRGIQETRFSRPSQGGFTLVETLVAGVVLVVGLIMIAQFFASAMARTTTSDIRSVLSQVANREIEDVRALPYNDVGTTDGWPKGILSPTATRTEDRVTISITREVVFVTDESYSGPYPANYKRVTISVSAVDHPALGPVSLSTFVAGGAEGGTLDITVTDTQGTPIPNVQISVTNTHLVPHVNMTSSALRTNALGKLIIPGLKPDTEYEVAASKSGYSSAFTEAPQVVNEGVPYTVVQLIIDRLSTMVIRLVDAEGTPIPASPSLNMRVTGPYGYDELQSTGSDSSAWFNNIGFSTELNPYVAALLPGQGYEPASMNVILPPNTTLYTDMIVDAPTTTTTTAATTTTTGYTTTTGAWTTTTRQRTGSLLVTVYRQGSNDRLRDVRVTLSGIGTQNTNSWGQTSFNNIPYGTYTISVRGSYYDYYEYPSSGYGYAVIDGYTVQDGTVVINGNKTATVYLRRR